MIFGQVHRLMRLPENILPEGIRSSHKNGVLHVDIPKGEESEKKEKVAEISISSSE